MELLGHQFDYVVKRNDKWYPLVKDRDRLDNGAFVIGFDFAGDHTVGVFNYLSYNPDEYFTSTASGELRLLNYETKIHKARFEHFHNAKDFGIDITDVDQLNRYLNVLGL